MTLQKDVIEATGVRFSECRDGNEVARAYLYVLHNNLHDEPFGLLEDVHVEDRFRGKGIGSKLVKEVIKHARDIGCYKLLATSRHSRPQVHELYERLGFINYGIEFRLTLSTSP